MGTPQYMSPEQCRGEPTDPRTDVYSLGATFYAMLAAQPLFTAETALAVLHKQIYDDPEPLCEVAPSVPAELAEIIHKMIAKDKEERFQSAEDALKALLALRKQFHAKTISNAAVPGTVAATPSERKVASVGDGAPKKKKGLLIGAVLAVVIAVAIVLAIVLPGPGPSSTGTITGTQTSVVSVTSGTGTGTGTITSTSATGANTSANTGVDPANAIEKQRQLDYLAARSAVNSAIGDERLVAAETAYLKLVGFASGPEEMDEVSRIKESLDSLKNELAEKNRVRKYRAKLEMVRNAMSSRQYDSAVELLDELNKLAKLEAERIEIRRIETNLDEVLKGKRFAFKIQKAMDVRNWKKILEMLEGRAGLVGSALKALAWARLEQQETVDVGTDGKKILVDRYEVSNQQFRAFIDDGGYSTRKYWSDNGWNWKEKSAVSGPAFFEDSDFNSPDQPVCGVSFFEAEAYASWAGKRLPTNREWLAAAGADSGLKWPWGADGEKDKVNSRNSYLGITEAVTAHVDSAGPSGCINMCGNVMEWCQPANGSSTANARGGSFVAWLADSTTKSYLKMPLKTREMDLGFRCVSEMEGE